MESSFDAIQGYIERAQSRRDMIANTIEQLNAASSLRGPVGGVPSGRGGSGPSQGRVGNGEAVMPIKGVGFTAGSAGDFGDRTHPVTGDSSSHTGYDFSAAAGTKIRATTGGRVVSVGWDPIYGWETIIKTKNGFINQYAHQVRKPKMISPGDKIKAGQVIGRVGSTGLSTGPHLHYGVQNKRGAWINPVKYLDRLLGRD
jgi:murein DD-endopeptidase MepM/ murein hydrolase activator NlpD